ncbi:MAG: hypothetical protein L3K15_04085 [Thermoplasmata archaeon]|nr:hypothetical protein [Thermoplasmata archaeon]
MVAVRTCSTRSARPSRTTPWLIVLVVAAVGGAGLVLLSSSPTRPPASLARAASVSGTTLDPTLPISPGTWTMAAGTHAVFSATLGNLPSGCAIVALEVTWSLPGIASQDGFLNSSSGLQVELLTFAGAGGPASVAATGTGEVACNGQLYGVGPSGTAEVTIVPSLALGSPVVAPDPATVGSLVTLEETVAGGVAPYAITLDFGDGTSGSTSLAAPGPLVVVHRYLEGRFSPLWSIVDGIGDVGRAEPMQPLVVTNILAVVITPSARTVDVGVSTTFIANITGGSPPFAVSWTFSTGGFGLGPSWTVIPSAPGTIDVRAVVVDAGGASAASDATLRVAPPLRLEESTVTPTGDVGRSIPFFVNVTGGVAPFTVTWGPVGGVANRSAALTADGWYVEPAVAPTVGTLWMTALAVDADGARVTTTSAIAEIYPPPGLTLATGSLVVEAGHPLLVGGLLTGGAPPLAWSLSPSLPVNTTSPATGTMNGTGAFSFRATPVTGGNLTILGTARDAAGAIASANVTVRVLPPVLVALLPVPTLSVGSAATLSADIGGGQPPYAYAVTVSDGERLLGNLSGGGPVDFTIAPRVTGYIELHVVVTDVLGGRTDVALTGVVAAGGPASTPPGTTPPTGSAAAPSVGAPTWVAAILGAGGVVAAILLPRRRRRKRGGESSGRAEAMQSVRRYLQESEGLDRTTLYFLAEDDGISETATDDALRRWMRSGRIRTGPGPDEEELFTWGGAASGVPDRRPAADREESDP